jgi:hypothetical protein
MYYCRVMAGFPKFSQTRTHGAGSGRGELPSPLVLETGHRGHHETSFSAVDVKATMPSSTLVIALTKLCKDNVSYYAIVGSIIFA